MQICIELRLGPPLPGFFDVAVAARARGYVGHNRKSGWKSSEAEKGPRREWGESPDLRGFHNSFSDLVKAIKICLLLWCKTVTLQYPGGLGLVAARRAREGGMRHEGGCGGWGRASSLSQCARSLAPS